MTEGPPASPRPGGRPEWVSELRAVASEGWVHAVRRASLAFAAMWLLGTALALGVFLAEPGSLSVAGVLQLGGLLFYGFHHVAIRTELSFGPGDVPGGAELSVVAVGSVLLATAAAGWLLWRAGRTLASARGGPLWARAVHGAKPAVPYAALSFALSFVVRLSPEVPSGAGIPTASPVPASALWWTLALGLAFGAAGAAATGLGSLEGGWDRRVAGWLAGGWRMTWLAVALATVGLLVLAAIDRQATRAYFEFVSDRSPAQGVLVIVLTALLVPNLALAVSTVAMGGAVSLGLLGTSCPVLSFGRFPEGLSVPSQVIPPIGGDACAGLPVQLGPPPAAYFLFLLVPLVATVAGGWRGAERAAAPRSGEAALAGAGGGVTFAFLLVAAMILSGLSWRPTGLAAALAGAVSLGPRTSTGFPLALAWGVVGGAVGGLLWARRAARSPEPPRDAVPENVVIEEG